MPRFFFHLRDGDQLDDPDGMILDSIQDAREEAVRSARHMMASDVKEGRLCLHDRIIIADENGNAVMAVPFRDVVRIEDHG